MRVLRYAPLSIVAAIAIVAACSASSSDNSFGSGTTAGAGGTGAPETGGQAGTPATGGTGGTSVTPWDASPSNDPDANGQITNCNAGPDEDKDGDGYSINQGDCNDCDPNANPGAFDVVGGVDGGPGVDEDCNGIVDDEPANCDTGLSLTSVEPMEFARAIGLCRTAIAGAQGKERTWGVIEARLGTTQIDTNPSAWTDPKLFGILDKFGTNNHPQEGVKLVALSSGTARDEATGGTNPNGIGYMTSLTSAYPPGFPKNKQDCPTPLSTAANDPVSLYLKIRVPTNAKSFSYNFNFFSAEYQEWLCTEYNDVFVALLHSQIPGNPADSNNISFDANHNPVCVNIGFFGASNPNDLAGTFLTGYPPTGAYKDDGIGGSTGWLMTQAPVKPGEEITLQFAIWDTSDHSWDSTVLLDNFQWSVDAASEAETVPVPQPR